MANLNELNPVSVSRCPTCGGPVATVRSRRVSGMYEIECPCGTKLEVPDSVEEFICSNCDRHGKISFALNRRKE